MQNYSFEWDITKETTNQRKHDVSFEEAKSVFLDENAIQFYDFDHSNEEERYIMLGFSAKLRLLVVIHTFRKADNVIRIILARKATKKESSFYGGKK